MVNVFVLVYSVLARVRNELSKLRDLLPLLTRRILALGAKSRLYFTWMMHSVVLNASKT